jgi:DNA-binding NtrC family response regulator
MGSPVFRNGIMTKRALVIDGKGLLRRLCPEVLKSLGFETGLADSTAQALASLTSHPAEIVLADVHSAGTSAIELLKSIKRQSPETDVVLMADSGSIAEAVEAIKLGAYDYLSNIDKPFKVDDLKALLQRLIEKRRLTSENRVLREELESIQGFGNLVGASDVMQSVYRMVLKIAPKRHPVLVLGESGTGKELVARAVHKYSPWCDKPFVPIDCGALPPALIESELFGHVKGAITGADQSRVGLLASAQGGTVFLDEIGELPVTLQVKLLRALQEREFKAIGSNTAVRMEARVVAATNQDLEAAVRKGTFRKDLYYRLDVVSIILPPLRDRKADIALVHSFIERHSGDEAGITGISYEALQCLLDYDWPGNVRELENCIQHALALGSGSLIQVIDLPASLVNPISPAEPATAAGRGIPSLEMLEQRAILQALEESGGDRLRAARLLGIGKTTIYRKLKEYGIEEVASSVLNSARL